MIPEKIKKEHILKAIEKIERAGIPKGRSSKKFNLEYRGKHYPPKYIISLAYKYASGKELDSSEFSGGQETNNFLKRLGFDIVETSSLTLAKPNSAKNKTFEKIQKEHDERCPHCKKTVEKMLRKIFGKVESNYKFEVSTNPEEHRDSPFYQDLKEIRLGLEKHRGHMDFVRTPTLPPCDFFVPKPGFIVEFDESQHFTLSRKISLQNYPQSLRLGFSLTEWSTLCEKISAKDNDPPFRDEQRAWYDTLRDFMPELRGLEPTVRLYSKEMQWCGLNPEKPEAVAKFRELIENRRKGSRSWVATVILQSNEKYSKSERLKALSQIVDLVAKETDGGGVILFPAGWFNAKKQEARSLYKWAEKNVKKILAKNKGNIVICLGIDGKYDEGKDQSKDQIAIAISKHGIRARGRKFHPTKDEKGFIKTANDYSSMEEGKPRIFSLNGKKYFLAVCYDGFGIRQERIPNFGIDVILDLVHGFYPKGEAGSSESYFARHGFAGASKEWDCLVFGAAVFFKREIPNRWPSGVYWNKGKKSTKKWEYEDNSIKPIKIKELPNIKEGVASVRIYNLEVI